MKTTITITDDLIDNVMAYTHSSTVSEAVNIALKDWMVFHRMRELSEKLASNSLYMGSRQLTRKSRVYKMA
jgi:Arc/MetJ family transcription regulator